MQETDRPEIVRVFNLIKTLHDLVAEDAAQQPFLIPIGERAEKIAEAFEDRQLHTRAALDEFTALLEETKEAKEEFEQSGLSAEGFATVWYLRGKGLSDAVELGRKADQAFAAYPHWRTDSKQEQRVRMELYKALMAAGIKTGITDMVDEVLTNLRRMPA